jgi:adenine-specific DNA-methyltransferase
MIYSRLIVSRSLLCEDGVIFISIDDNELRNLKNICDEVFGERNFIGQWNWYKSATPPNLSKKIKKNIEFVLCYQKGGNNNTFTGVKKTSSSDDPITKPQNTFKELTFKPGWIHAKFSDGIIKAGTYGTSKFPNELLNDLIIENGLNKNEVTFRNRFIWVQETLEDQINNGTRINLSKALVISYKKADYSAEVPPNLIDDKVNVSTTEKAGDELDTLFDGKTIFDYPKPPSLIKYLTNFDTPKDDSIILDFFSGSATTAHAIMQLNAEDNGSRKFIMVQLPEESAQDSEAYKAGYMNICEIGKERIRRAGEKIKEEHPEAKGLDTGFRVFKCESSNYKDVAFAPKDYTQDMLAGLLDNIKEDRTDLDLLFDCLLRWGVELSMPLSSQKVDGCTIHNVNDGDLVACFDGNVTEKVIDAIAALSPVRVVFRDSSFNEAANKMNLFELFKQKCDWTDEEVKNNVRVI